MKNKTKTILTLEESCPTKWRYYNFCVQLYINKNQNELDMNKNQNIITSFLFFLKKNFHPVSEGFGKLIFSLLFFCVLSNTMGTPTDSVLQAVSYLKGDKKLKALTDLYLSSNPREIDSYSIINTLEQESRKQKSDDYLATALYFKLIYSTRKGISVDTLESYANEAIALYSDIDKPYGRGNVEILLIGYYLDCGNLSLALLRAQNFLRKTNNDYDKGVAYHLLGASYKAIGQGKEAAEASRKAVEVFQSNLTVDFRFRGRLYESYVQLIDINILLLHDYKDAFELIRELGIILQKEEIAEFKEEYEFQNQLLETTAYLMIKDNVNARKALDKAEVRINKIVEEQGRLIDTWVYVLKSVYGEYYINTGDYTKALTFINEVIDHNKQVNNHINIIQATKQKALVLDSLGLYRQASALKSELISLTDSLQLSQTTRQLAQMQTLYQVQQLEAEKIQNKLKLQQSYLIIGATAIIVLLFIILLVIEKRNSKRLREKNLKLFEQHKHISEKESDILPRQFGSSDILLCASKTSTEKQGIFNKAIAYLLENKNYLSGDIDREVLALQIGTNRQYLIEAIQECQQMTYSEFIVNLRLEHARKLLLQKNDLTIDTVLQLSGFNNRSTFYKHFNTKYGMTPAEFRKLAKENSINVEMKRNAKQNGANSINME